MLCQAVVPALAATQPRLVLIIDDVGARHDDERVLQLPKAVTLAFLPHTPYGRELALQAWHQDRESMLHLPMAGAPGKDTGPWAIQPGLDRWQVQYRVKKALADIPFVTGVNNHMGSAITHNAQTMHWVMEELAPRQLYFVDSLTTPGSRAFDQARQQGIPSMKRDVFLDPMPGMQIIERQWQQALQIARKHGEVVVIGHPYDNTLAFLERALPEMGDVELVPASALMSDGPAGRAEGKLAEARSDGSAVSL